MSLNKFRKCVALLCRVKVERGWETYDELI